MEIFGYIASVLIGVILGLIGAGGSILTMPVLVYLMGVKPVEATGYSLFIVGLTAALGAVPYFRQGLVNVRTAVVFGIPSIIAVYATQAWLMPALPSEIFRMGRFVMTKDLLTMAVFALLMIASSYSMIKKDKPHEEKNSESFQKFNYPLIFLEGTVVGVLTGFVGAGGGFLIIPALVVLSRLPMKQAVGTSLLIIAAKSLIGFTGGRNFASLDWRLLILMSVFSVIGIFIGALLSRRIDGKKLKPAFGWFVLVMGVYILIKETIGIQGV
ncbi:MAG: sulfite exporter TauE/SafE family protein [Flavobacteriales bacterium]|nr:sulfite exporter TauE/SafE family protein [Flavobacteriales bacterium]MCX7767706.1 sulfite exporter TauE/SafE family protein [Flavobacteriales bacterium]MDW8409399.1 sulfite exporter TauE/SafE family protein [Flavobacteriales bacterium]